MEGVSHTNYEEGARTMATKSTTKTTTRTTAKKAVSKAPAKKAPAAPVKRAPAPPARVLTTARKAAATTAKKDGLDRGQQARQVAVKLNNQRGPGRKLTDEELVAYIRRVRKAHPTSTVRAEAEYAYWVEGIAVGNARFAAIWDTVKK